MIGSTVDDLTEGRLSTLFIRTNRKKILRLFAKDTAGNLYPGSMKPICSDAIILKFR
jgi:hypothetical protein